MFQIKGNYKYHVEVICASLNETTMITVNAFPSKSEKVPIACKYQWCRIQKEKQRLDITGNIYPCSVFDIGFKLEVTITSFEEDLEGTAVVEFDRVSISQSLESKLVSVCHNNMRYFFIVCSQMIYVNDQPWNFAVDGLEIKNQKKPYTDALFQSTTDQKNVIMDNQILKFKSKEDKDRFVAIFITMGAIKRIHLKFIANNIGTMQSKNINFQQLLYSQFPTLIVMDKSQSIPSYRPVIDNSSSQQLNSQVAILSREKATLERQIETLQKENSDLREKAQTVPRDQVESLDRLVQSLKGELYQHKSRQEELIKANQRLTIQITELQSQQQHDLSRSQFFQDLNLQEKYDKLLQEYNRLQDQKAQTGNDSKLLKQNQQLMNEIQQQSLKIKDLQFELEMVRNQSRMSISVLDESNIKQRIEPLEQENIYLQKKIQILEDEINKKKQKSGGKQQNMVNDQLQKLNEANKRYMEENLRLFEEVRELRDRWEMQSVNQSLRESRVVEHTTYQHLQSELRAAQQRANLEISGMKKKMEKQGEDLYESRKFVEQLRSQNQRLEEEVASLTEQLRSVSRINDSVDLSFCKKKIEQLNEELKGQNSQKQNEQVQLKKRLERVTDELFENKKQLEQLRQANKRLVEENIQLNEQLALNGSRISNDSSIRQNQEITTLKRQIQELQSHNQRLVKQNEPLNESGIDDFQQMISKIDNDSLRKRLEAQIQQLNQQLEESQNRIVQNLKEFQQQNAIKQKEIQVLSAQVTQLQQRNNQLQQEIDQSASSARLSQLPNIQNQLKAIQQEKQFLQTENSNLTQRINTLKEEQIKYNREIQDLKNHYEQEKIQLSKTLTQQLSNHNNESSYVKQLEGQLLTARKQNADLLLQINSLEDQRNMSFSRSMYQSQDGGEQFSNFQKQISDLQLENQSLHLRLQTARQEKLQLTNEYHDKLTEIRKYYQSSDLEKQLLQARSQNAELLLMIQQRANKSVLSDSMITDSHNETQETKQRERELKAEIEKCQKSRQELQHKYEELFQQKVQLEESTRGYIKTIADLKEQLKDVETLSFEIQQIRRQNSELLMHKKSEDEINYSFSRSLIHNQQEVHLLQEQNQQLANRNTQLLEEIASLQKQTQHEPQAHKDRVYQFQIQQLEEDRDRLYQDIQTLKNQLLSDMDKKIKIDALEQQLLTARKQNAELLDMLNSIEQNKLNQSYSSYQSSISESMLITKNNVQNQ